MEKSSESVISVDELLFTKHKLPTVARVERNQEDDGVCTSLPWNTDIVFDVVRDVEFIRARMLNPANKREDDFHEYDNDFGENREILIPAEFDRKLKFVQTEPKVYTYVSQVFVSLYLYN